MEFATSAELLSFHKVMYTLYALMIISVIAWFGYNLTRKEKAKSIVRIPFYTYMAFLVITGVGHHIFTYNSIPWVSQDIMRHEIKPDATYEFKVKDHKWIGLPKQINIKCGETVRFIVHSEDLIYGFGLFRKDGSMVMQMQVNPGSTTRAIWSKNDIVWTFRENGVFDLVSTEYSGPAQYTEDGKDLMKVVDFVKVTGCKEGGNI